MEDLSIDDRWGQDDMTLTPTNASLALPATDSNRLDDQRPPNKKLI